jgi:hypothetical protein
MIAHAREQSDAVEVQNVKRISNLLERTVNIGQRHERERAEPLRRIAYPPGLKLIAGARYGAQAMTIFEQHARRE